MVFRKSIRVGDISQLTVVVSGPKFTKLLLFNAGGTVVDNAVCRLSIYPSVPEIFALKVESCPKSRLAVVMDIHGYIHGYYADTFFN